MYATVLRGLSRKKPPTKCEVTARAPHEKSIYVCIEVEAIDENVYGYPMQIKMLHADARQFVRQLTKVLEDSLP